VGTAITAVLGGLTPGLARPTLSGMRYSRGGITLKVSKAGRITVKRPGRRKTACELL